MTGAPAGSVLAADLLAPGSVLAAGLRAPGGSLAAGLLAPGSLTDVAGIAVGHAELAGRPSGCTVVLCPEGAVGGVAVRGGAPGTRETDLLAPGTLVPQVHAVLLTGGSAFGLDAAGGVMRWLEERGHGYAVGPAAADIRVPIVPAAVLFDLWLGDPRLRPDATTGYAACEAACDASGTQPPVQGNAGAGAGATVGKLFGIDRAMKGGVGTASLQRAGITVGALVAVNAVGDVRADDGRILAGARTADGRGLLDSTAALCAEPASATTASEAAAAADGAGTATTIGVVATDAVLDKAQAQRLAGLAHHGLSRAISPLTLADGDTLFVLATGRSGRSVDAAELGALGALAAEAVARAIRNGVLAAAGLPGLPAASDLAANVADDAHPGPSS